MIRSILAATAAAAFVMPMTAEDAQIGPDVGDTAPVIAAMTSTGDSADLAAISGTEGAVLVFSRSLDWCPFCKTQANDLNEIATDLSETGYDLSLVTYDAPETLEAYGTANGLTYALLSDTDSAMIDGFNLRNADVPAGSRFDGIPHPAVIFVSTDGTVEAVLREDGYRDRPANELILETAKTLAGAE